jgi:hypothetical protein
VIELDERDEFPKALVRRMCGDELGVQLLFVPEEHGGMGGSALDVYRVCERMAAIDLGIATSVLATFLGSDPISVGGTPAQQALWLGRVAEEGILMAYGATEPDAGSDLPAAMRDAEIAVVWDVHLGGRPLSLIGIESRPLRRRGVIPADGPEQWTSGTLFPRSSKKIARAINAASGRRPLVVLANLAGFDGSPESMREWQLEFGAEIGRAVVNFDGPIVFCVVSRYHGGAFVVFSQRLNENLTAVAVEGAHASVIGGAPAAAVVFARDVEQAARRDARIVGLDERIAAAEGPERQRLRAEHAALWETVLSEKRGALAGEFDAVHSVERAVEMGSVSRIIRPQSLRPFLIDAVEQGILRPLDRRTAADGGARLAHRLPR